MRKGRWGWFSRAPPWGGGGASSAPPPHCMDTGNQDIILILEAQSVNEPKTQDDAVWLQHRWKLMKLFLESYARHHHIV